MGLSLCVRECVSVLGRVSVQLFLRLSTIFMPKRFSIVGSYDKRSVKVIKFLLTVIVAGFMWIYNSFSYLKRKRLRRFLEQLQIKVKLF